MAQHLFASETTPSLVDLDSNFNELYARAGKFTPGGVSTSVLGYGATPSASWTSGQSAFDFGAGAFGSMQGGSVVHSFQVANCYGTGSLDPTATVWKYTGTGTATLYEQINGTHRWKYAGSGSSNATITWITAVMIDTSGNFNINQTAGGNQNVNGVSILGSSGAVYANHLSGTVTGTAYGAFCYAGSAIGSITQSGTTAVAYNTSSDYRLKDNIQPLTGSGVFIDALRSRSWTWKADGTPGAGFIAHELQEVSPGSVHGTKDAMQPVGELTLADGTVLHDRPRPATLDDGVTWVRTGDAPVYQQVEYGSAEVIAMLVAEVQDLRRRLQAAGL
jgi:hypothetical protein